VLEQPGEKWSRIAKSDELGTIMPDGMDGIATWLSHTPTPQLYIVHSPLLHTAEPCAERSNAISNSAFPKAVLVMLSRFYTAEEFHLCFGYLKKISKKMHQRRLTIIHWLEKSTCTDLWMAKLCEEERARLDVYS
jgi:hypothetical protein